MNAGGPIDQECVEAYVFVRRPRQLLILRRPPPRESIWAPVSGKVDASDRDLESALWRELREETGFEPSHPLLDLAWAVTFEGPSGGRWRLHAYGVELDGPRVPHLSPEHVDFAWLPFEVARSRLHYEDNRAAVDRLAQRLGPGPAAGNP